MVSRRATRVHIDAVLFVFTVVGLGVDSAAAIDYSVINDDANDGILFSNASPQTGGSSDGTRLIGSSTVSNRALNTIYFFELPDASLLMSTTRYAMEFYYVSADNSPTFDVELYGLGFRSSPATLDTEWFYEGTLDTTARSDYTPTTGSAAAGSIDLIQDGVITTASTAGTRIAVQSTAMDGFVQSLYADGAIGGDSAIFRFNADASTTGISGSAGYRIVMDNTGGNAANRAELKALNVPFAGDTFEGLATGSTIGGATSGADLSDGSSSWSNAWIESGTQPATVVAASMSYSNRAGTVDGGTTALEIHGANSGSQLNNSAARRAFDTAFTGEELYFRYLVQADSNGLDSNDFFVLWLDNEAGGDDSNHQETSAFLGIRAGDTFFARINSSAEENVTLDVAAGETYMLVGRLYSDSSGDGYNMLDFWVDPEGGDVTSPDGTVDLGSSNTAFSSVTHFGFRTGQNTEVGDTFLVDAIAFGTSWDQVVPTPEPGTIAMLFGGLLLVGLPRLLRRHRRKS